MVIPPRVQDGGAGVEGLLDVGSLILRHMAFMPMTFLGLG
jgi:hypothetical protein